MITIYHNPRCSKSREALAVVQDFADQHGKPFTIIEYLKTPLNAAQLHTICELLAQTSAQSYAVALQSMVRDGEEAYQQRQLAQADSATLLAALEQEPRLLQRPIVVCQQKAMIARPVAGLAQWLHTFAM